MGSTGASTDACPDLIEVCKRNDESLIEAALAWVENISSPPNLWADTPDHNLIEAVFASFPALREPMEARWKEARRG